jgi:hypothetical protein
VINIKSFIKKNRVLLLIIILALLLRLCFLSPWLEDWDSVQFALALKDFSLIKQQPHSPGYPLYIFLGRIFNFFLHNDTLALTSLSAVLGSLCALPLYFLITDITKNKKIALIAIVIFLVTPAQWSLSEAALSNIPGMFFSICSAYLIFKGRKSLKLLYWGSFLLGISLGVRFAEYSTVIVLLGLVLYIRKKIPDLIKSAICFTTGILVWLIPMVLVTGLGTFISLYKNQAGYIVNHDSLLSQNSSLIERLIRIKWLLTTGYSLYFLIPVLIITIYFFRKKIILFKNINLLFALFWLISYSIPLLFIYNLEVPRHVLPLLPPLVILFAIAVGSLWEWKLVKLFTAITIIFLFSVSLREAKLIHTLTPPTISPILYVKDNLKPSEVTLFTSFTYRQFQYYAPEYLNYWVDVNTPQTINTKFVVTDYIGTKTKFALLNNYQMFDTKEFVGPQEIFPRVSKINIFTYQAE